MKEWTRKFFEAQAEEEQLMMEEDARDKVMEWTSALQLHDDDEATAAMATVEAAAKLAATTMATTAVSATVAATAEESAMAITIATEQQHFRPSVPPFPTDTVGTVVQTKVEIDFARTAFFFEGLSPPDVDGVRWERCATEHKRLKDKKEQAVKERRLQMRQKARDRQNRIANPAIQAPVQMNPAGENGVRTQKT